MRVDVHEIILGKEEQLFVSMYQFHGSIHMIAMDQHRNPDTIIR